MQLNTHHNIPFASVDVQCPQIAEEHLFEALKPAVPGLQDVSLKRDGGAQFAGSNVALRHCLISSGVHPAIEARSIDCNSPPEVTFHMARFGWARFRLGAMREVRAEPSRCVLIGTQEWHADTSQYGGLVIRLPRHMLRDALSLALDQQVDVRDVEQFPCGTDAGLWQGLSALQMLYQRALARSGVYDQQIVNLVALHIAQFRHANIDALKRRMHELVDRVCREVRNNIKSEITVADLANSAGISQRYLQIAFQAVHGTNPKQWILNEKLRSARQDILTNPAIKITQIAEDYSFSSPAHFSNAFRKAFGVAPTSVRS